jgi:hypothetical protein
MQLIFKMELYSVHIYFAPLEILSARPLLVGIDKLIRFLFSFDIEKVGIFSYFRAVQLIL